MTAKLDGVYTRLLRAATNTSWETHITNQQLYGKIPKLSTTICRRRLRFSGHCFRSKNEIIHKVILWEPKHGKRYRGRPYTTYIDTIENDTGIKRENLPAVMEDRNQWKVVVENARKNSNYILP